MPQNPLITLMAALVVALLGLGCSGSQPTLSDLGSKVGLTTAANLAGSYTGVLEGITVPSTDVLGDSSKQVIVDIDLLHPLKATDQGGLNLMLESAIIPKTRALMLGVGTAAINLQFIDFEGLAAFPADHAAHFLQVKNILFVNYQGEWILVAQMVRVGFPADKGLNGVYVYQYVSYPKALARQMSQNEAVQYVNTILKLASAAQRP